MTNRKVLTAVAAFCMVLLAAGVFCGAAAAAEESAAGSTSAITVGDGKIVAGFTGANVLLAGAHAEYDGELEKQLDKFKRPTRKVGKLQELRKREFFEKPSEKIKKHNELKRPMVRSVAYAELVHSDSSLKPFDNDRGHIKPGRSVFY